MQDMTSDALWHRLETAIEKAILSRARWELAETGSEEENTASSIAFKRKCEAHVALIGLINGEAAAESAAQRHEHTTEEAEGATP
jgi:hypothetical protein